MTYLISSWSSSSNWLYFLGTLYFPLVYFTVYTLLKRFLPRRISSRYLITLSMRLVGSLQSLAACVCGVIVVSRCRGDIMRDTCWLANAFAKLCTCYFFIDLYVMYLSYVELKRDEMSSEKKKLAIEAMTRHLIHVIVTSKNSSIGTN